MNNDQNRTSKEAPSLKWIEGISKLLDSSFTIPGTTFKFGLDPIIGMIPFVGDAATFFVSFALYTNMVKYGASRKVAILMAFNIIFDFIIGNIPFVGWLFDFSFRANDKNIRLLKEHYQEGKHQGSGKGLIGLVLVIMLLVFGLVCFGLYKLVLYVIHLF